LRHAYKKPLLSPRISMLNMANPTNKTSLNRRWGHFCGTGMVMEIGCC